MPSSANYVRNYKQEQVTARKRGETKDRAARNKARRKAIKAGTAKKGDGKDVGHVTSLKSKPKNNNRTRIQSASSNRSAGGRSGSRAGKARGGRKGK